MLCEIYTYIVRNGRLVKHYESVKKKTNKRIDETHIKIKE